MARNEGTFDFSANFEVKTKGTIDARQLVNTFSDLLDFTESNFIPTGFPVSVSSTSTFNGTEYTNGIYECIDEDNVGLEASWKKANIQDISGKLDKRTKKPISTATYTFEADDVNKYIEFSNECVATVPDGLPADLEFQGEQVGTGALTFEASTTLNVFSGFLKETAGQHAVFGIRTKGSDIATLTGTLKLA